MKITFKSEIPVSESMIFEEIFDEDFRYSEADKKEMLEPCIKLYMFVDGELAGEMYGCQIVELDEEIPDTEKYSPLDFYLHSMAVIEKFRRKGLAKIMAAHFIGLAKGFGISLIIGHSINGGTTATMKFFGAEFGGTEHKNWYGSDKTACLFTMNLQ